MENKQIITWDLGATKCAAGLVTYNTQTGELSCQRHYHIKLAQTHSLAHLISQIETGLDFAIPDADAICIGAAGHFNGKILWHENPYPYSMPFHDLAQELHWPAYTVIHDYAPVVCATFTSYMSQPKNITRLNDQPLQSHGRRVALGIGTGLGLKDGVLLQNGDFWLGKNEIGHIGITMPPQADYHYVNRHQELIRYLQQQLLLEPNQTITFEKILSGQGTVRLYQFLYPNKAPMTPEQVGEEMREGRAPEMVAAFAWYAGLFVGTVQLSFMPESGVWITGGVALNHLEIFDHPDFFAGIHSSPAYLSERHNYPLGILRNHEHTLMGSAYYAVKRLLAA